MRSTHTYYVYIVECTDGSYYTGVTNDIDRRLWEHNNDEKKTAYTYSRRPVILKYCENFQFVQNAIAWEKQLKGWSRKKKEALFREDWDEIKRLAKSYSSIKNGGEGNNSSSPGSD
jgi:putative endonuclease